MVHAGDYGEYFNFLLDELHEGPYWSSVKAQLGQPKKEYDPEASVSGSREPQPKDTSSDSDSEDTVSDSDWEYLSDVLTKKSGDTA